MTAPTLAPSSAELTLAAWSHRDLDEVRFVMLDTETTGVEEDARIFEVAVRGWCTSGRRHYPRPLEFLVHPGCQIPPASSAVHHVTDRAVHGKPPLSAELPGLLAYVDQAPIVAFNSDFDQGKFRGTPLFDHLWLDAYRMVMHVWHLGEKNPDGFPLTSFKQQELRYWLKLPTIAGDAHRAGADIMLTGLLFQEVVKKYKQMGYPSTLGAFVAWVQSPILHKTIPIGGRPYSGKGSVPDLCGSCPLTNSIKHLRIRLSVQRAPAACANTDRGQSRGKTPEEVETWALKKAFDPSEPVYNSFKKYNVLEALWPEYSRRVGLAPSPAGAPKRSAHVGKPAPPVAPEPAKPAPVARSTFRPRQHS